MGKKIIFLLAITGLVVAEKSPLGADSLEGFAAQIDAAAAKVNSELYTLSNEYGMPRTQQSIANATEGVNTLMTETAASLEKILEEAAQTLKEAEQHISALGNSTKKELAAAAAQTEKSPKNQAPATPEQTTAENKARPPAPDSRVK